MKSTIAVIAMLAAVAASAVRGDTMLVFPDGTTSTGLQLELRMEIKIYRYPLVWTSETRYLGSYPNMASCQKDVEKTVQNEQDRIGFWDPSLITFVQVQCVPQVGNSPL